VPDFVVGAPVGFCSAPDFAFGYIRAYDGATLDVLWQTDGKINSFLGVGGMVHFTGSKFGTRAEEGPDISGDGIADVYGLHSGGNDEISILSGATGATLYHLDNPRFSVLMGSPHSIYSGGGDILGDLNGDGLVEFAFANPVYSTPMHMNAGRVFIFSGGPGDAVPFCSAPPNSSGRSGTLRTVGPITEGAPDLEFEISNGPAGVYSMLFYSLPDPMAPAMSLGSGSLCLSAQGAGRYDAPMLLNGAGAGRVAIDWSDPSLQGAWAGGTTWSIQAGFRDPGDPLGANTTNALEILFTR